MWCWLTLLAKTSPLEPTLAHAHKLSKKKVKFSGYPGGGVAP